MGRDCKANTTEYISEENILPASAFIFLWGLACSFNIDLTSHKQKKYRGSSSRNWSSVLFKLTIISYLAKSLYAQSIQDGLVAYYPFDGNAEDLSGNAINGITHNVQLTYDYLEHENSAYSFNGIDSYIEIVNSKTLVVNRSPYQVWNTKNWMCGSGVWS